MLYDQLKVKGAGAKGRGLLVMRFACPLKPQKKNNDEEATVSLQIMAVANEIRVNATVAADL